MRVRTGLRTSVPVLMALALIAGVQAVCAQAPGAKLGKPKSKETAKPKPKEEGVEFAFSQEPWKRVIDWLEKQTGMQKYAPYNLPTGTIDFASPPGRRLLLPEIIDQINELMQQKRYMIVRQVRTFTVWPADKQIPPHLVPFIPLADLEKRGRTELVSVLIPLRTQLAAVLAPQAKLMLGDYGEVTPFPVPNYLKVQGKAGGIQILVDAIDQMEKAQNTSYTYACKYVRARVIGERLKELLSPTEVKGNDISQVLAASITWNDPTQTVHVKGSPPMVAQAKILITSLDVGEVRLARGPAKSQQYLLNTDSAEKLAQFLQEKYKDVKGFLATNVGARMLVVQAVPADQNVVAEFISGTNKEPIKAPREFAMIPLMTLDAATEAATLSSIFGPTESGGPFIEADTIQNAITVNGPKQVVDEIRSIIKKRETGAGGRRTFSVDGGGARLLAIEIQKLMKKMGKDVELVVPDRPKLNFPKKENKPARPDTSFEQPVIFLQEQPQQSQQPKKKDKIRIIAAGDKLIVETGDADALREIQDLVRIIKESNATTGDFEVIPLRLADATEVATVLDELFNGKKQTGGGGRGGSRSSRGGGSSGRGGFNPLAMMQQLTGGLTGAPTNPTENRIRVVAHPPTNSLLVKAGRLDMLRIRELLDTHIDNGKVDSKALVRTWPPLPLQYANASDISDILSDVYKEQMSGKSQQSSSRSSGGSGFPFFRGSSSRSSSSSSGGASKLDLTVGVDDLNNSLIVRCNELLYDDIKLLTKALDDAAKNSTRKIVVRKVGALDPVLFETAINAIQGNATMTNGGTGSGLPFGRSPFLMRGPFGSSGRTGGSGAPGGFSGRPGGFSGRPGGGFSGRPSGGGSRGGSRGSRGGRSGRGGGGGGGGGGGQPPQTRGPDFFEQPVKDDHRKSSFFDPQRDKQQQSRNQAPIYQQKTISGRLPQRTGPNFFEQPVKDDRRNSSFYDPRQDKTQTIQRKTAQPERNQVLPSPNIEHRQPNGNSRWIYKPVQRPQFGIGRQPARPVQPVVFQDTQPNGKGKLPEGKDKPPEFRAPRRDVRIISIPELGILLIDGDPEDLKEIDRIIEFIKKGAEDAQIDIQLYRCKHGDATVVSEKLTQFLDQVNLGAAAVTTTGTAARQFQQTGGFLFGGQQQQPATGAGSVALLTLPRTNSILIAAPKGRMPDIFKNIREYFDVPNSSKAVPIPLKQASASQVANFISTFFLQRYAGEAQNQVRVTFDTNTNTVFVIASPADLADIREMAEWMDSTSNNQVKVDLRIIGLKYGNASDLALLISRSISEGAVPPGTQQQTAGAIPGLAGQQLPGQQQVPGLQQPGVLPGQQQQGGLFPGGITTPGTTLVTKTGTLRFFTGKDDKATVESGVLQDVRIYPDIRTNRLLIAAPTKTMQLILALVRDLDVPPAARSEVNVFTLKKSDATAIATLLQQLFLGAGGQIPGAAGGFGGQLPGQLQGGGLQGQLQGQLQGGIRPLLPVFGQPVPGAAQVDLRLTIDPRTNSLIVAGSRSDLDLIEAIITKLEDNPLAERRTELYKLKNALAADVAQTLNDYLALTQDTFINTPALPQFLQLQREVVIVPEPINNYLLISATSHRFDEVMRLLFELDRLPPQVMIQALIANVVIDDINEFGVEFGFQSPVLFQRSILPGGAVDNQAAVPGFFFSQDPTSSLGQATLTNPGVVGLQALNSFGTGRISSNAGVGGFVFSAASDSVNVLVRALRTQGRLDILSAPRVTTADNQAARVQVGSRFPLITGAQSAVGLTGIPTFTSQIQYEDTGVILDVIPKINPDGTVVMRVIPQIIQPTDTQVSVAPGVFAQALDIQTVETTVIAQDGETVVLGGLIAKRNEKDENKIPWLGDLPGVGALFRFRSQLKTKAELIVILTPHIIRCRADADRLLYEESRRQDWILGDVLRMHGPSGMEPVMPGYMPAPRRPHPIPSPYAAYPTFPGEAPFLPHGIEPQPALPRTGGAPPSAEQLPAPQVIPPDSQGNVHPPVTQPQQEQRQQPQSARPAAQPHVTGYQGNQQRFSTNAPNPGVSLPTPNPSRIPTQTQPHQFGSSPVSHLPPQLPAGANAGRHTNYGQRVPVTGAIPNSVPAGHGTPQSLNLPPPALQGASYRPTAQNTGNYIYERSQ